MTLWSSRFLSFEDENSYIGEMLKMQFSAPIEPRKVAMTAFGPGRQSGTAAFTVSVGG
jgi:hypothetical protein